MQIEWIKLAKSACKHAGVKAQKIEVLTTWEEGHSSNAVFFVNDDVYLKLFGPKVPEQYQIEKTILQEMAAYPVVSCPKVLASGSPPDVSPYLILTSVPGEPIRDIWEQMDSRTRKSIGEQLGKIVAVLHTVNPDGLVQVEDRFGGCADFASHWRQSVTDMVRATKSIAENTRRSVVDFLSEEAALLVANSSNTLVHREITNSHVYVKWQENQWSVSGIIDWADSMIGPQEWDIAFVWLYTLNRDRSAMRRFLSERFHGQSKEGLGRRCLGAVLQTYDGPDLWSELCEVSDWSISQPVESMVSHLFPDDVFA